MTKADNKSGQDKKRAAEQQGRRAETVALWYLRAKGYRCLARRLRTPFGELDLVMRHRGGLVFVEVKQRETVAVAIEALGTRQHQRLRRAASWYVAQQNLPSDVSMRFDMIAIARGGFPRHIKNI
ncbi:MAG: hypothetical protein CMF31_06985 [Kordiimonas sp.]|nr:hypothetical protein [Kordiimonas sp.]|tara:strand:+ start:1389 stop:1763 length:375 start_codon:yes stop_codon:yes gene_type:complete